MVRSMRLTWLLVAICAALLIAAACGGDGDDGPTTTACPERTPGAAVEGTGEVLTKEAILAKDPCVTKCAEVVWGYMFERTGPLQGFGEPSGDGLLMAVQEINAAGGFQVGDTIYTIRLIEKDTRSDVAQAVALTTELVQDEGVKVLWGPATIGDAESTEITKAGDVLHLCPCPEREVTSLATEEKAQNESPLVFQTLPAPSRFLPPGARQLAKDRPEFRTFATICVNSSIGQSFCDFFRDAYVAAGFEHVGQETFPAGTVDFSPFLTSIKEQDPDIVLNFTDAGTAQFSLLNDAWELDVGDYHIAVALPYELFEGLVGAGIRDKIVSAGAAPRTHAQYTSEKSRAFFEETYKPFKGGTLPPAAFAALLTYDPAFMVIAAMQAAGTVDDPARIAEALRGIHYNGVGEDDLFFEGRHVIVSGSDSCLATGGRYVECHHNPPPPLEND